MAGIVAAKQSATTSEFVRTMKIKLIKTISPENAQEIEKHRHNLIEILQNSNATMIRDHNDVGYSCYFCADKYRLPADLKKHNINKHCPAVTQKIIHGELRRICIKLDITDLFCKICKERVNTIEKLILHLSKVHDRKIFLDIKQQIVPFKFYSENLQCYVCSSIFMKFKPLLEHMNIHFKNYVCSVCDAGFVNKGKLTAHTTNSHKHDDHKCEVCPKVFNTYNKKRNHEQRVHEKTFCIRCGYCNQLFKNVRHKDKHLAIEHGVAKVSQKCSACDKCFSNSHALLIHMKRDHLVLRPHQCEDCDKSFFTKSELRFHMLKHTGKREFKCKICLKSYSRKWTLTEHMRIHADDRRYKCELCGQAFVQKCSLQSHTRTKHREQHKVETNH